MECNKDEAIRARELAEMKMKNNDFEGAQKIALKAQDLHPGLENITQLISICDVHCAAQKLVSGSEKDLYGLLQVPKFADEMTIKKQYRRLALLLHPDKNRFPGAESAFKLICEANDVLSDPQNKVLYDQRIRVKVTSAQVVPPHDHLNKTSQFDKQYGPEIKVTDGFRSMNQHQTPQSSFSARQEVFCTSSQNGIPNYVGSEQDVQNGMGYSASQMASQWCANKQTVRTQPSFQTETIFKDKEVERAANVDGDLKAERSGKEDRTCSGDRNNRKDGNRKNKRKGRTGGSDSLESSESYDTSSESNLEDVNDVATDPDSGPTNVHFSQSSSRKRQNVSYNEGAGDDDVAVPRSCKRSQGNKLPEDNENGQSNALNGESVKHENQNGLHADSEFSKSESKETGSDTDIEVKTKEKGGCTPNIGADAVDSEIDSDYDAYSGDDSDKDVYEYEDPEFNNFDKDRNANCFAVNQYWACYDTVDGMPRFFAKVNEVQLSPFELSITWLVADPAGDTHKKWIDEDLPVGCGVFKLGEDQKMSSRLMFSQQVHCEMGNRGSLYIYPRQGEVWAVFKDWDLSWSSKPASLRKYIYEIVEVLSDASSGATVCYLDKVEGFVSLFQRSSQSTTESFIIRPNEMYRFSHCIRSYEMTGSEREGVPVGSFELDPSVLPMNPDYLCYPAKSKSGIGKKNVVGSDTKVFVDLESSDSDGAFTC